MFENVYATISVKDIQSAKTWYEHVLGRPADSSPMDGLLQWHFASGGALQVVGGAELAGCSTATLVVSDRDAVLDQLRAKDIGIEKTIESNVTKTALLKDPEGNQLIIAQML